MAAIPVDQLPQVPRFLEVPDPDHPGRQLEIGPTDVARLMALPTMRRRGNRPDQRAG